MEEYAKAFTKYIDELIELKVREKVLETYLGKHLYIDKKDVCEIMGIPFVGEKDDD